MAVLTSPIDQKCIDKNGNLNVVYYRYMGDLAATINDLQTRVAELERLNNAE